MTSLAAWEDLQESYASYFSYNMYRFPKTISTIKALLFMKSERPDINDVTFLKTIKLATLDDLGFSEAAKERHLTLSSGLAKYYTPASGSPKHKQ